MRRTMTIAIAATLVGCSNLYEIKGANDESLPGVPFIPAVPRDYAKVVYQEAWLVLKFSATVNQCAQVDAQNKCTQRATEDSEIVVTRYFTPYCAEEVIDSYYAATGPKAAYENVRQILIQGDTWTTEDGKQCRGSSTPAAFQSVNDIAPATGSRSVADEPHKRPVLQLTSSTIETKIEHAASAHYINVEKPWIGSTTATVKLDANGRLTEATATVDDDTFETITALLPIKEFITSDLDINEAEDEQSATDTRLFKKASLSQSSMVYVYSLSAPIQRFNTAGAPQVVAAPKSNSPGVAFSAVAQSSGSSSDKKKSDGISFSGSITLPEGDKSDASKK